MREVVVNDFIGKGCDGGVVFGVFVVLSSGSDTKYMRQYLYTNKRTSKTLRVRAVLNDLDREE